VYADWPPAFPSLAVTAVDLQDGLSVERASMADYAQRVVAAAQGMPPPVAICGWSMGGLVVLQAAQHVHAHSVILLEPSAPAEIQGYNPDVPIIEGAFDPEAEYGRFPGGIPARPESRGARAARKRPSPRSAPRGSPVSRGVSTDGVKTTAAPLR
jgi:pimeloyl-ACP methyl ester carboxylesterase